MDALADLFQRKALRVLVFLLVDTERAVVIAVIGDKDGDSRAPDSGLVRIAHLLLLFLWFDLTTLPSTGTIVNKLGTSEKTNEKSRPFVSFSG
jgi:hypothetical protein